ncbi:MAG: choice-of-anchor Q domain-containing protein [Planctomycetota bacterium]|jgi:hypothetical protein
MGEKTNLKRSLVMAILLAGMVNIGWGDVIYVKAGASGAGTSWADATGDLPGALAAAVDGNDIWVAEGVYKPGASQTDSFQMKNGVGIYGGFAASGDPGWGDRDPNIYQTILSGDLNDDDLPGFDNLGTLLDNCTHVFYHPSGLGLNGTAILDGVTISGGFSMGTGDSAHGAGMYNNTASPTVTGCKFLNSVALGDMDTIIGHGGGMYNENSTPAVTNCDFTSNTSWGSGGGMYNENSEPAVTNCDFTSNTSWGSGGGMYNNNSDPCIIDCRFTANTLIRMEYSSGGGGGMANTGSNPTITGCRFVDNEAMHPDQMTLLIGGGMLMDGSSSPMLTDCVFTGNSAEMGGGMVIGTGCSPTITDCTFANNKVHSDYALFPGNGGGIANGGTPIMTGCEFRGNTAEDDGGGLYSDVAGWTLNRCTFLNNSAGNNGGGIFLWNSTTATNCIFAYNSASYRGGGIYINSDITGIVTNCTFYNNTASDEGGGIFAGNYATLTLTNSILWSDKPDEIGKTVLATATVSYCDIQDTSYAGSGGNFVSDPLFVDALNDNFHLQIESPCINAGNNSAPGIPSEDIDGNYRIMYGQVEIGADEIAPVYVNASALGKNDGSKWPDAFTDFQDAVDSAPGGVDIWVAAGTYKPGNERTDSFSLKGGEVIYGGFPASGDSDWGDRDARVYPTILSGDIGVEGTIADNCYHVMQNEGRAGQSVSYLDGFIITGGNANGDDEFCRGGGISNFFFDLYLTNCLLVDNSAEIGGGVCSLGSFVSLINCLLSGNKALSGGGMYNFLSFTDLINCTISGNAADVGGGALNGGYSEMSASNCIFWSNNIYNREIYNSGDSFVTVRYSDVQGGYPGTGNINSDPRFVNPDGGDFRLQPDSPCIETADNTVTDLPATDLDGHPRIVDGDCNEVDVVDMGAYEFNWHGAGDFDNDCFINFFDFSISARYWMTDESFVDIAPPGGDGIVNFREVAIIADNWLAGTMP